MTSWLQKLLISGIGIVVLCVGPVPVYGDAFKASTLESVVSVLPIREANDASVPEPEGSGIVVFDGRYIATANHVLSGAKRIDIRLNDLRVRRARLVGRDPFSDIALLEITSALSPLKTGAEPVLGADVCSVGNQFGLGLSVTCGVVSAVRRTNAGFNPVEDFIQTDAVVNPGASGGALLDNEGRLVGMVSGIFTKDSDANIGINFAVHTDLLMRVLYALRVHGRVPRNRSGLVVGEIEGIERETITGVHVLRISENSPAQRAGLRPGDVITALGGRKIMRPGDVSASLYARPPGYEVSVDYSRGDPLENHSTILRIGN